MIEAKSRTLRMYEDKGLLPKHKGVDKKLYSINDIQKIAFVHYIASVKKVNANGIKYVLELLENHVDKGLKEKIMENVEEKLDAIPAKEIDEVETL
jgi:DNA-binding transcriptional MerR regulator